MEDWNSPNVPRNVFETFFSVFGMIVAGGRGMCTGEQECFGTLFGHERRVESVMRTWKLLYIMFEQRFAKGIRTIANLYLFIRHK